MKKLLVFAFATALLSGPILADFQSPPGGKQNRLRKLTRGFGNILYGINELPTTWRRTLEEEGSVPAASYGVIKGSYRSLVRAGYGAFEFTTFPVRTYKGSFKPGYRGRNIMWDLNNGYHEYALEIGFQSRYGGARQSDY